MASFSMNSLARIWSRSGGSVEGSQNQSILGRAHGRFEPLRTALVRFGPRSGWVCKCALRNSFEAPISRMRSTWIAPNVAVSSWIQSEMKSSQTRGNISDMSLPTCTIDFVCSPSIEHLMSAEIEPKSEVQPSLPARRRVQ